MSNPDFEKFGNPEDRVIEECSELIKEIVKAKRFGFTNYHPAEPNRINAQRILDEWDDVKRAMNGLEPLLQLLVKRETVTP